MITNRNNYDKIDSMKKLHIQKSITWCEKHDILCVKLYSSNNIFLSNIYDDGTPIYSFKNNNNAFLKGKSSNFTNNVYIGGGGGGGGGAGAGAGGTYNKNKSNPLSESENLVNEIISNDIILNEVLTYDASSRNNSE
jgi:hypothetical protein